MLLAPDLFVRRSATRRLLRLAATPWARLVLKLGVATGPIGRLALRRSGQEAPIDFPVVLTRRLPVLLVAVVGLSGCAGQVPTPALFAAQQTATDRAQERPRLFYIGLALYPEGWSENDVVELADALQRNNEFDAPLIASNLDPARAQVSDRRRFGDRPARRDRRRTARPADVVAAAYQHAWRTRARWRARSATGRRPH